MEKIITRLRPNDHTVAEVFVDGSLVATIPMWQIEQLVTEMQKIKNRPMPPDAVIMAGDVQFEYSDDLSLLGKDGWNYTQEGPEGFKVVRIKKSKSTPNDHPPHPT